MDPGSPVLGGHAILSLSANPGRVSPPLLDFVHMRIGGANPGSAAVLRHVDDALSDRNENIRHMVRAVFAHESAFTQFKNDAQTRAAMNFTQRHHQNDPTQPDCHVVFDWPDDPPHFPLATFDFGVGISQYTKVGARTIPGAIAWDWTANVDLGMNLFLGLLRHNFAAGITWKDWARPAWQNYNGSGPQAVQYATALLHSPEGSQVSADVVPADLEVEAQTDPLPARNDLDEPPAWPTE